MPYVMQRMRMVATYDAKPWLDASMTLSAILGFRGKIGTLSWLAGRESVAARQLAGLLRTYEHSKLNGSPRGDGAVEYK